MSSIFTKIINREIPGHIVKENDNCIAFLDINPLRKGHTLVVPKKEIDYVFNMSPDEYQDLFNFARPVADAIEKSYPCQRIGVSIIGLEVPHVHIHLVPIDKINDLNFSKPKLTLSQEELEESVSLIISNLS